MGVTTAPACLRGRALVAFACALLSLPLSAAAEGACRVAVDLGSSGMRAGASNSAAIVKRDIDALTLLNGPEGPAAALVPAVAALDELMRQGKFDAGCARVGGGFSAWRIAAQRDAAALAGVLTEIRKASGVAVVVIPQAQEGAYGHYASRRALGERLTTSHVLDLGGGSLEISGEHASVGDTLGQKVWQRLLCRELRPRAAQPCTLQPLSAAELTKARALLDARLKELVAPLPPGVTLTAVSRPVSRGVLPALLRLGGEGVDKDGFSRAALTAAIERLAGLTLESTAAKTGAPLRHAGYLLSDMILLEGLLRATGGNTLRAADIDLTNVPGLLADDRAYAWGGRYGCYLERLKAQGVAAWDGDPAACP